MRSDYICSLCRGPAQPKLDYTGLVADCDNRCVEASLLVLDEDIPSMYRPPYRPLTAREESDLLEQLWTNETADWSPAQKAQFRVSH